MNGERLIHTDGTGFIFIVRGLEEEIVYSASEIYNLIERGSAKRHTAETLLNKQSRYIQMLYFFLFYLHATCLLYNYNSKYLKISNLCHPGIAAVHTPYSLSQFTVKKLLRRVRSSLNVESLIL
jgi:hypothetical protein